MRVRYWMPAALVILLVGVLAVTSIGTVSMAAGGAGAASPISLFSTSASGSVVVGDFSKATPIPSPFWGVDVEPDQRFNSADAASVAATPVTYIRFPGGLLGEEFNYTSGIITNLDGSQSRSSTSTAEFVAACKQIGCHAIMQLPAEIDQPATAAYYANYVVHTLGYQPAYWEFGNSPSGWTHFNVPWSNWKSGGGGNITPLPFANLVHTYITAVLKVDPAAKFLALGAGMGGKSKGVPTYSKPWVEELAKVDGQALSGISVHSYVLGGPSNPTDAELLANLNGVYSLSAEVTADRSFIKAACPTCTNMGVFVTEINAAEVGSYAKLLTSFAGTLYLAADTVQGLALQVPNLDWFCYDCGYAGAWSQHPLKWQMQYYLFSDIMTQLKTETLPTTVTGPSTLYAIATYDKSGLALLLVNAGTTTGVSVGLAQSGFVLGHAGVTEYSWQDGSKLPTKSSVTLSSTVNLPALSIVLLTVGTSGTKSPGQPALPAATTPIASSPGLHSSGPVLVGASGSRGMPFPWPAKSAPLVLPGTGEPAPLFLATSRDN
jgi:hypothetical protein